jgi:hypothetical protein
VLPYSNFAMEPPEQLPNPRDSLRVGNGNLQGRLLNVDRREDHGERWGLKQPNATAVTHTAPLGHRSRGDAVATPPQLLCAASIAAFRHPCTAPNSGAWPRFAYACWSLPAYRARHAAGPPWRERAFRAAPIPPRSSSLYQGAANTMLVATGFTQSLQRPHDGARLI